MKTTTPKTTRNTLLLLLTSLIWGIAFVAQSTGGDAVGAYSFNCIRSLIGGIVLIPAISLLDHLKLTKTAGGEAKNDKRLLTGGILCGILLCIASNLQQVAINLGSSVGKAGFLTACYILFVPMLGIFLKKKCGITVWIGVALALAGLYLLCISESFSLQKSDILLLLCALFFACQILVVDHFSPMVDGVRMACIEFFTCGILTAVPMFLVDMKHSAAGITVWASNLTSAAAWISILYAGVFSCGVAYTLQIVGQQDLNPAIASLIMSLESVFSVLAGWLILHQVLSLRELFGCVLLFAAILIAQL